MIAASESLASPWAHSPTVSLIVVSAGPCSELRRVLTQLAEGEPTCSEIVVVRPEPMPFEIRALLAETGARYVEASAGLALPELRELGASKASGQVVVIREDRSLVGASLFNRFERRAPLERQVPLRTEVDRAVPHSVAPARQARVARIAAEGAPA
jgi:hypothetical protein